MRTKLNSFFEKKYHEVVAQWMLIAWMLLPLMMGIINYAMINSFSYNPYVYNDCYRVCANTLLTVILLGMIMIFFSFVIYKNWKLNDIWDCVKNKEKWMIIWIGLMIWSLVCVGASADSKGSFFGTTSLSSGYVSYLFAFAIMICASIIKSKEEIIKLLLLFCAISDVLAVIMISFNYDVPFIKCFSADVGNSVFTNSNHYGYYLSMAVMCMAGMYYMYLTDDFGENIENRKMMIVFCFASFVLNVYAVMLNDSLGAYVAIVVSLCVAIIFWKVRTKKLSFYHMLPMLLIVVLTIMSFMGILSNKVDGSIGKSIIKLWKDIFKISTHAEGYRKAGTNRWGLWIDACKAIGQRPLLGYGPDIQFDALGNRVVPQAPHNEFLECGVYLGIPGILLYLGGLIALCVDRCKKLRYLHYTKIVAAGAVVAYLVGSVFGVRKFYTVPFLYVFWGMIIDWDDNAK